MPCDEVPRVYRVNHVKRLYSVSQNKSFEGQLPKLRYYHHIKKIEPQEENNNVPSVKSQPITASSKKNSSSGQLKITGKSVELFNPFAQRINITFTCAAVSATDNISVLSTDFLKEKKRLTVTTKKKQWSVWAALAWCWLFKQESSAQDPLIYIFRYFHTRWTFSAFSKSFRVRISFVFVWNFYFYERWINLMLKRGSTADFAVVRIKTRELKVLQHLKRNFGESLSAKHWIKMKCLRKLNALRFQLFMRF